MVGFSLRTKTWSTSTWIRFCPLLVCVVLIGLAHFMNLNAPIRLRKIKTFKKTIHTISNHLSEMLLCELAYVRHHAASIVTRWIPGAYNDLWFSSYEVNEPLKVALWDMDAVIWLCEIALCSLAEEHRLRSSDGPDEGLEPRSVHDWLSAYGMRFPASRWKV